MNKSWINLENDERMEVLRAARRMGDPLLIGRATVRQRRGKGEQEVLSSLANA